MGNLTADEVHVLLDVIEGDASPWTGYTSTPDEDPKASESGWKRVLASAGAKLEEALNTL